MNLYHFRKYFEISRRELSNSFKTFVMSFWTFSKIVFKSMQFINIFGVLEMFSLSYVLQFYFLFKLFKNSYFEKEAYHSKGRLVSLHITVIISFQSNLTENISLGFLDKTEICNKVHVFSEGHKN